MLVHSYPALRGLACASARVRTSASAVNTLTFKRHKRQGRVQALRAGQGGETHDSRRTRNQPAHVPGPAGPPSQARLRQLHRDGGGARCRASLLEATAAPSDPEVSSGPAASRARRRPRQPEVDSHGRLNRGWFRVERGIHLARVRPPCSTPPGHARPPSVRTGRDTPSSAALGPARVGARMGPPTARSRVGPQDPHNGLSELNGSPVGLNGGL